MIASAHHNRHASRPPSGRGAVLPACILSLVTALGWVEISPNLLDWQPAGAMMTRTAIEPSTGGFARVTFTSTQPPAGPRWFVRYAVEKKGSSAESVGKE